MLEPTVTNDGLEGLLDTKAAATILGIAETTLEIWRSTGRYGLPFVRVGRRVRYRRSDIEAWLNSRVRTAA